MHGDELQVVVGRDKGEDVREPQLQPHDSRQHQGHQPDPDRSDRVLDGDDFCVLAPDVLPDKGLRVVELWLFDFGRWNVSRFVMGNGGHRWFLIAESSLSSIRPGQVIIMITV